MAFFYWLRYPNNRKSPL